MVLHSMLAHSPTFLFLMSGLLLVLYVVARLVRRMGRHMLERFRRT
ncbi:hypothetical protein ACFPN1_14500 [Lysobacter yangpyeongensis]|uniref:Uncharacterized protein n=1 Tax=Lysobacter yangpyeongensis TaxID=346182 RepID=A0ABW0SRH5_9GAMM